jgi:hypothetical protein
LTLAGSLHASRTYCGPTSLHHRSTFMPFTNHSS